MISPKAHSLNRLVSIAFGAFALLSSPARAEEKLPDYLNPALPVEARIDDLLPRMTLDEKLAQVHANGKFRAGGVPRLKVPYLWMADGPQGVREETTLDTWESAGLTSDFATAMPPGMALASSWNTDLAELYGKVVGEEACARGKHVMLAPGVNIMRSPLCGRNYDYYGEDPWLTARMTVGYVKGIQGEQVVACIKHYALNNQEQYRGFIDVVVDERALREIYLPAFEYGVKEAGALSIMGAYNKHRGEFCCQSELLLNQILKKEWGFKGGVISDWGATHDTREAALKGLDLEMGGWGSYDKYKFGTALRDSLTKGEIPMSVLDDKVRRNLRMLYFSGAFDGRRPGSINTKEHLDAARRVAEEGAVLLKNEGGLLPLDPAKVHRIAVIGENAVRTYARGGNSAGVKAFKEVTAFDGIVARVHRQADVLFSEGYCQPERRPFGKRDAAGVRTSDLSAANPEEAKALAERALEVARQSDVVIFIGGLSHQSRGDDEGVDRSDLSLSAGQDQLISRIVEVNPRTVVVLISGAPLSMEGWLAKTPAVLQAWYGGSEAGTALASLLFGDTNPSGKLPCTFPKSLADSPAHQGGVRTFPGEKGQVLYDEGIFVGYRWFDAKKIEPLFPFGFGLSYTSFNYSNLRVTGSDGPTPVVECDIANTGARAGAEVVQLYVHPEKSGVIRPEKELKAFAKVSLAPGEKKTVKLSLAPRSFAYFSTEKHGWVAEAGDYSLLVGASSRDIRLTGSCRLPQTISAD